MSREIRVANVCAGFAAADLGTGLHLGLTPVELWVGRKRRWVESGGCKGRHVERGERDDRRVYNGLKRKSMNPPAVNSASRVIFQLLFSSPDHVPCITTQLTYDSHHGVQVHVGFQRRLGLF